MKIIQQISDILVVGDSSVTFKDIKIRLIILIIVAILLSIPFSQFFHIPFYISLPIMLVAAIIILFKYTTVNTIIIDKSNDRIILQRGSNVLYSFPYHLNSISAIKLQSRKSVSTGKYILQLYIVTNDGKEEKLLESYISSELTVVGPAIFKAAGLYTVSQTKFDPAKVGKQISSFLNISYSDNLMNSSITV